MKKQMIQLATAMFAGSALMAGAQQPTRPMQMQNSPAMECMMAIHSMMGEGMRGGMMRPGEGPMAAMRGEPREMMHDSSHIPGMMNDSSHMAQMRSELGLTEPQMQQLHTILQRACSAAQPHMTLALQAHKAAMQGLHGDNPSLDHFEDQLENAAKHMVAAQVEMAKGMIDVHKALTPEQRQKMDQMHKEMMKGNSQ